MSTSFRLWLDPSATRSSLIAPGAASEHRIVPPGAGKGEATLRVARIERRGGAPAR